MFGFLKKKIKNLASKFSKKVEEEKSKEIEEKKEEKIEKKSVIEKIKKKITEKKITEKDFEKLFDDLEIVLLENNVAMEVIEKMGDELKKELIGKSVKRKEINEIIINSIRNAISDVLIEFDDEIIFNKIKENKKDKKPTIFLFLGVNGVGKTTTLAKFGYLLKNKGYSCIFSASDTFRAASIEQLEVHGKNLGIKVIKHKYGADAAAVAYDSIEYAKAHGIDCVLIDSAGRQHTSSNLMDELAKIKRVSNPDFTIFVADSMTGNDATEQAKEFENKVGYDFSILTKADVDEKGGAILSVGYISKKPIAFLGVGQEYKNLIPFKKDEIINKLIGNDG